MLRVYADENEESKEKSGEKTYLVPRASFRDGSRRQLFQKQMSRARQIKSIYKEERKKGAQENALQDREL